MNDGRHGEKESSAVIIELSVGNVHLDFFASQFFELTSTFSSFNGALEHFKTGVHWNHDQRVDQDVWFAISIKLSLISSEVYDYTVSVLLFQTDNTEVAVGGWWSRK
jgi:hypothetical protein